MRVNAKRGAERSFFARTWVYQTHWAVDVTADDTWQFQGRRHFVSRSLKDDNPQEVTPAGLQVQTVQGANRPTDFAFFEPLTLALDESAAVLDTSRTEKGTLLVFR
jgi:hypothetical protein